MIVAINNFRKAELAETNNLFKMEKKKEAIARKQKAEKERKEAMEKRKIERQRKKELEQIKKKDITATN